MIHIIIKFLICFTKPKSPPKKEQKKKNSKSPVPARKKSTTRRSKPSKDSEPKEETPVINNEKVVQCQEQVREWCHIEYCLFEDVLPIVELTVVTWGDAAKIYIENDWRALKTVTVGECVWVHFTVVHKISKLTDEQVELMKDNVIVFKFSQDLTKMGPNPANDWPKTFEVCTCESSDDTLDKRLFCELRQTDPPDETHNSAFAQARLDDYKMKNVGGSNQIATLLQLPPCNKNIKDKMNAVMKTLPLIVAVDKPVGKMKSKQVGKKVKQDSKTDVQDKSKLSLKCLLLIAGKTNVCVESKGISPSLLYAATFTSSSKILTEEQCVSFVPLTVTIEEVVNIPRQYLEDMNIRSVFARYELAQLFEEMVTHTVPVQNDGGSLCHADVDDTQLWFISDPAERERYEQLTKRLSVLNMIESVLTRRLVVKLIGVKSSVEERVVEPCLFGQRNTDKFISTPGHPMYLEFKEPPPPVKEVLLGSACFNLVQLVKGLLTFEGSSALSSAPVSSWNSACDWIQLTENVETEKERRKLLDAFSVCGVIPDHILMQHFTSVKIKVTLGCHINNVSEKTLILLPNVFHRVIVVFRNYRCACATVDRITSTNMTLNDPTSSESVTSTTVANMVQRYTNDPRERPKRTRTSSVVFNPSVGSRRTLASIRGAGLPSEVVQQIKELRKTISCSTRSITGFFVKHEEESLLVLESIPFVTNLVIDSLQGFTPADGRIVYDNSVFFTQRLYNVFPTNLFEIELTASLDTLLTRTAPYLNNDQTIDSEAAQALLLLDFLRRTRTVNDASVNQLFPSADQLIAFHMEFADDQLTPMPTSHWARSSL